MTLPSTKTCPNCLADLETTDNFCPNCGQNAHIHRFNLPHVAHEVVHALTHADKGVLHLIRELTIRPGVVAREYVLEGKRKKYFNPFTFLALTVGLVVLSNSIFHPYTHTAGPGVIRQDAVNVQPEQQAEHDRMERQQTMMKFIEKRGNILLFLAVPLFAFVYWLFFRKTGINFAEQLVAHVFFMGFYALFYAFIQTPLFQILPTGPVGSLVPLGVQFLYLTVAYVQFLPGTVSLKPLKTATAALVALVSWFVISGGIGALYVGFG